MTVIYKFSDQLITDLCALSEKTTGPLKVKPQNLPPSFAIKLTGQLTSYLSDWSDHQVNGKYGYMPVEKVKTANDPKVIKQGRYEERPKSVLLLDVEYTFDEEVFERQNNLVALDAIKKKPLLKENILANQKRAFMSAKVTQVLLVYLSTGRPDLRTFIFPADGTRAEKTRASMEFANENCVLVGYSWQKHRRQHTNSWYSSGHFWMAPVGQNRSEREIRWRSGCEKSHKQTEEA